MMRISKVGAVDRTTPARVRKLFIANPPTGTTTRDYYNPVEMLPQIFSTPECIARFDFVHIPRVEDSTRGDEDENESVQPIYFPKAHKLLMKFIYSRTANQTVFTDEATKYIEQRAEELAKLCDGIHIPLLQPNEATFTIARGAAASAAGRFSVDETGNVIIVHKADAIVWADTLAANYAHESTNYFSYSYEKNRTIKFQNSEEFFQVVADVRPLFEKVRDMPDFFLKHGTFNFKYMGEMFDIEPDKLKKIYGALIRNSLIDVRASNSSFTKTRRGIAVFKYLNKLKDDMWSFVDEEKCKNYFNTLAN
jgi:hypothetical protein